MTYRSNLQPLTDRMRRARLAGLIASADLLIEEIQTRLRGGFTSGAFATGQVVDSVMRSAPDVERDTIRVGTKWFYALAWEVGHINAFTRTFERHEVWVPTLLATKERIRLAYARAYRAVFEATS